MPVAALNFTMSSAGIGRGLSPRCPASWPSPGPRWCSGRRQQPCAGSGPGSWCRGRAWRQRRSGRARCAVLGRALCSGRPRSRCRLGRAVPSAGLPSRSSMNKVCIFWAAGALGPRPLLLAHWRGSSAARWAAGTAATAAGRAVEPRPAGSGESGRDPAGWNRGRSSCSRGPGVNERPRVLAPGASAVPSTRHATPSHADVSALPSPISTHRPRVPTHDPAKA